MNHLDYGQFDSTNEDIAFSQENLYTDPSSETETRKQLSYPLKEIKTFLGNTMPINQSNNVVQLQVTNTNKLRYRTTAGSSSWTNVAGGIPEGGTQYRAVVKNSVLDNDVAWGMPSYVGMVIMNTFSSEAQVQAVYGSNTRWTLRSSVILSSEHVFGNGYALGLTSGSDEDPKRYGLRFLTSTANRLVPGDSAYGSQLNSNTSSSSVSPANTECVGVITKARIESDTTTDTPKYERSGLVADTYTIYTWERTV